MTNTSVRLHITTAKGGNVWFLVSLQGGWTACYRLVAQEGRPVVAELRVLPDPVSHRKGGEPVGAPEPPGGGVTASLLKHEVIMGRHIYELLPVALQDEEAGTFRVFGQDTTIKQWILGMLGFDPDARPKRGRRGPKGWPDEDYAQLAAHYVKACGSGSRSPVLDVANERHMTDSALRAALHRARKRGVLTRQTAGRAGGQLTDYGKSLLRKRRVRKKQTRSNKRR